jgi:hypothetical protein
MRIRKIIICGVAAFAVALCTSGCRKSAEGTFNELNDTFQLAWPKDTTTPQATEWKYRSALEGSQSTKVTLAKVALRPEQLKAFVSMNSNRVRLVQMDDRPSDLSKYNERCSWWDLGRFDAYKFFALESRSSKDKGNLQGFVTQSGTNAVVFLIGHTSRR